jgi:amino acid permease
MSERQPLFSSVLDDYNTIDTDDEKIIEVGNYESEKGFFWPVALAFCVNYVIGTGFQALPYASQEAGLVPTVIILLIATTFAFISSNWQLEVCARAAVVWNFQNPEHKHLNASKVIDKHSDPLVSKSIQSDHEGEFHPSDPDSEDEKEWLVSDKIFEVTELCKMFVGNWLSQVYTIVIIVYMFGSLSAYTVVLGVTLVYVVPFPGLTSPDECNANTDSSCPEFNESCEFAYILYVLIVGVMVVLIACLDLKEQKSLQVTLALVRGLGLLLIIICIIGGIATSPYLTDCDSDGVCDSHSSGSNIYTPVNWAQFSGLATFTTSAIYAQLLHHSTPGLAQLVDRKEDLQKTFFSCFAICFSLYLTLCIFASLYFGPSTQEALSLQWSDYAGPTGWSGSSAWWAYFAQYFVLLFPALECFSAFPLCAVTLGNNIFTFLPSKWTNNGTSKTIRILCRLLASLPPLALGMSTHCLSLIVEITGELLFFFLS